MTREKEGFTLESANETKVSSENFDRIILFIECEKKLVSSIEEENVRKIYELFMLQTVTIKIFLETNSF